MIDKCITKLESSGYIPGNSSFPNDQQLLDGMFIYAVLFIGKLFLLKREILCTPKMDEKYLYPNGDHKII